MDLKADIREAVEKFANDSGYSGSIVEPYAVVIANLIDILGDTKYRELATLVYKISTCLEQPGQNGAAEDKSDKTDSGAPKLSRELKDEIIALIRQELAGTVGKPEPQPDKPVENIEAAVTDAPAVPAQNAAEEAEKKSETKEGV